jgi:hypothetical protein
MNKWIMMILKDELISFRRKFNMPAMPRVKGKAEKIAFEILGVPANMRFKRDKYQSRINQRLVFEETSRAR